MNLNSSSTPNIMEVISNWSNDLLRSTKLKFYLKMKVSFVINFDIIFVELTENSPQFFLKFLFFCVSCSIFKEIARIADITQCTCVDLFQNLFSSCEFHSSIPFPCILSSLSKAHKDNSCVVSRFVNGISYQPFAYLLMKISQRKWPSGDGIS